MGKLIPLSRHLNLEELRAALRYDPETGHLIWVNCSHKRLNGRRAGNHNGKGHRVVHIWGREYKEHRLIWYMVTGEEPGDNVDHKNRIRDDNRWENLRLADHSQNQMNSERYGEERGIQKLYNGKYRARISLNRQRLNLGTYSTREEALAARQAKAAEHYGEFCI